MSGVRLPPFNKKHHRIEFWNRHCPIGTAVIVTKDDGKEIETVTTSAAQLLSGHTPVVWLKGISGCYNLDRVRKK